MAVGIQVVKDGATLGASLSDTTSNATAEALGIDGGAGMDVVTNAGEIALEQVRADAHATSVSVMVSGAAKGLAAGAALSRSAAIAEADATGIDGGAERDEISNEGSISSNVAARADSLSVSGSLGVVSKGATLNASLSDSRAESRATTTGIAGGAGDDVLGQTAAGDIDLEAHAEAETVAVSVTISGAATGVAAGASLANSAERPAPRRRASTAAAVPTRLRTAARSGPTRAPRPMPRASPWASWWPPRVSRSAGDSPTRGRRPKCRRRASRAGRATT